MGRGRLSLIPVVVLFDGLHTDAARGQKLARVAFDVIHTLRCFVLLERALGDGFLADVAGEAFAVEEAILPHNGAAGTNPAVPRGDNLRKH